MIVKIKALTVNQAWRGRRFKTDKYDKYINDMMILLKPLEVPVGALHLDVTFGVSSKLADVDNLLKCFIDCLQKKYEFDDRRIYALTTKKIDVKKGAEYIDFNISALCD